MKILISPGFGAGWSSWCSDGEEALVFMLSYKPLIMTLEEGGDIGFDESVAITGNPVRPGSVLAKFIHDYKERFGGEPYVGGARDLTTADVDVPFRVVEYDGAESIEFRDRLDWIDPETSFLTTTEEDFD